MDIAQIKRNLALKRNNLEPPTHPLKGEAFVRAPVKEPSKPVIPRSSADLYNNSLESEEEKPKPRSVVWESEDGGYSKSPEGNPPSVESFIQKNELEDEKYDWRLKTSKGKRSHKNFTDFLVAEI